MTPEIRPRFGGLIRSVLWSVVAPLLAVQLLLRVVCAYVFAPSVTVILSPMLALVAFALLILWTIAYARRAQRRARSPA